MYCLETLFLGSLNHFKGTGKRPPFSLAYYIKYFNKQEKESVNDILKEQLTGLDLTALENLDDRLDCRTVMLRAVEKRGRYGQQKKVTPWGVGCLPMCGCLTKIFSQKLGG